MEYNYIDDCLSINNEQVDECSICLDLLDTTQEIAILNCKHKFHLNCYLLWKNSGKPYSLNCPLCLQKDVEIVNIVNTINIKVKKKQKKLKSFRKIIKTYPDSIENFKHINSFDIEEPLTIESSNNDNIDKEKCCVIL